MVKCPSHPRATKQRGYVFEHVFVWEKTHNQFVPTGYIVHHLNGIKDDNRSENLVAMPKKDHKPQTLLWETQKRIRVLEEKLAQLTPPL